MLRFITPEELMLEISAAKHETADICKISINSKGKPHFSFIIIYFLPNPSISLQAA
jgi:hypothetical protein